MHCTGWEDAGAETSFDPLNLRFSFFPRWNRFNSLFKVKTWPRISRIYFFLLLPRPLHLLRFLFFLSLHSIRRKMTRTREWERETGKEERKYLEQESTLASTSVSIFRSIVQAISYSITYSTCGVSWRVVVTKRMYKERRPIHMTRDTHGHPHGHPHGLFYIHVVTRRHCLRSKDIDDVSPHRHGHQLHTEKEWAGTLGELKWELSNLCDNSAQPFVNCL